MTREIVFTLSAVLAVTALCTQVYVRAGQTPPKDLIISAYESRPVAAAILELEKRHGLVITYEDPPYEWSADFEDVTTDVSRNPKSGRKIIVPRQKAFDFVYTEADVLRPHQLVSSMLARYSEREADEGFSVTQQGRIYHVIPTRSPDVNGRSTNRRSLLDVRVRLEPGSRSALEALRLVLTQVSGTNKVRIGMGMVPANLLDRTTVVQEGSKSETARDVIVRTLSATDQALSWRLLCSPGTPRLCHFNLHPVQVDAQ